MERAKKRAAEPAGLTWISGLPMSATTFGVIRDLTVVQFARLLDDLGLEMRIAEKSEPRRRPAMRRLA